MARQLEFLEFYGCFSRVFLLLEVRRHQHLDHFVVGACSDESRVPAPVDTVNAAVVVIGNLLHHLETSRIVILVVWLDVLERSQDLLGELAELEALGVSSQGEVL